MNTIGKVPVYLGAAYAPWRADYGYPYYVEPSVAHSQSGIASISLLSCGDWADPEVSASPSRLAVSRPKGKNGTRRKLQVPPLSTRIIAYNGRDFTPPGLPQMGWYDRITLPATRAATTTATSSACVSGAAQCFPATSGDMMFK